MPVAYLLLKAIRPFDCIEKTPLPVIFFLVAEGQGKGKYRVKRKNNP
jgi:hypothetical protein